MSAPADAAPHVPNEHTWKGYGLNDRTHRHRCSALLGNMEKSGSVVRAGRGLYAIAPGV